MKYGVWSLWGLLVLAGCSSPGVQPREANNETAAAYNLQLGVEYFQKGNLAQAKEKIDRSLQQNPKKAQTHMAAGLLYERLNEKEKADRFYSNAVDMEPNNGELLNAYAVFLCRNGKYEKGERLAVQAAGNPLYKTPEAAWFNAGICAQEAKQDEKAEQYFRKSLAANPRFAAALLQMVDLEYRTANYLPARAFLERFQQVAKPTAESLWLGYRIETALDNRQAAAEYARQLKTQFVTSMQAKLLIESEKKK